MNTKALRATFNKVYNSQSYIDRRTKMERWLNEFTGKWWPDSINEKYSKIFANFLFSTIQTTAPLLTDNRPIWAVRARDPRKQGIAEMWNKAGEYLWEKLNMENKVYLAVKDALLWPIGLLKLGYDADDDDISVDVDDPRTFVVAPGYDDLWKAAWCGVKVRKPMSWVKMTYPDKFDKVVADEEQEQRKGEKVPTEDIELEGEFVTVYEIWVRDNEVEEYIVKPEKKMANDSGEEIVVEEEEKGTRKKYPNGVIVTMTEGVLLEERESPFAHGKPPWIAFYDYRVPHDFWGMCEPMQIEELNREFNLRLQTLVRHAHRTQDPNYFLNAQSQLDPEKIKDEMLTGGNIWTVPYVGDDLIHQVPEAQLNASHLQLLEGIPTLIEEISGVTDISKGMASKRERQSASEVSILIESSYTRTRQRVRNLEWSISRLWYLIVELMQQFYTEPRSVSYKEDGQNVWMYAGNTPQVAQEATKPMQKPEEPQEDYQGRLASDEDYQYIVKTYLGNDPVHIDFDIEVQTNSMLPMDKQSLANLFLRLADTHITPDSPITMEAILEMLRVPNREKILKDKQRQMQMMMMQGAAK